MLVWQAPFPGSHLPRPSGAFFLRCVQTLPELSLFCWGLGRKHNMKRIKLNLPRLPTTTANNNKLTLHKHIYLTFLGALSVLTSLPRLACLTTPTVHSTLFIQSSPLEQIKRFCTSETLDYLLFSLREMPSEPRFTEYSKLWQNSGLPLHIGPHLVSSSLFKAVQGQPHLTKASPDKLTPSTHQLPTHYPFWDP